MAFSSKVGSFNIDTSKTVGQTQAITGVGFQPKIVLFWWSGSTGTGDGVAGGTIRPGFGAMVSASERYCSTFISIDGAATTDSSKRQANDACIAVESSTSVTDGFMDFSSMDADGFTLVVDDQFGTAWRISYLALGGTDLANVKIGQTANIPAGTGNFDTSGVGFQPDALITVFNGMNAFNGVASGALNIGMATGSSNQGAIANYTYDNQANTVANGYGYGGEVMVSLEAAGASGYSRSTFVSFLADGFRLNCLEVGASGRFGWYIALKGGQYTVSSLATRTDGNDITASTGFQPGAILFLSANRAQSTQDSPTDHVRFSIGAATSTTNRAAQAISDEDGLADSETAYANYDSAVYAQVVDDATVGLMDLKSVDATGFTCVMDDADPSACWVTYLAIGAAASTPTIDPAEATQSQTSDAATVSFTAPAVSLNPAESTQAQASDAANVAAVTAINGAESAQAQSSDAATVAAVTLISGAEATQSQTSDAATLTLIAVISPAEAAQSQASDAATLTFGTSSTVTPAEASQAQTSDAAALTVIYLLSAGEAAQGQTSDDAPVVAIYLLTAGEASQTQSSDAAGLSYTEPGAALTPAEATQAQTSDAVALAVVYLLTVGEALQAQTSDAVGMTLAGIETGWGNRTTYRHGVDSAYKHSADSDYQHAARANIKHGR